MYLVIYIAPFKILTSVRVLKHSSNQFLAATIDSCLERHYSGAIKVLGVLLYLLLFTCFHRKCPEAWSELRRIQLTYEHGHSNLTTGHLSLCGISNCLVLITDHLRMEG